VGIRRLSRFVGLMASRAFPYPEGFHRRLGLRVDACPVRDIQERRNNV
jgi:hypothetical protein